MSEALLLLPMPRFLSFTGDSHILQESRLVVVDAHLAQSLRFTALRWIRALETEQGLHWELAIDTAAPQSLVGLTLHVNPEKYSQPQSYTLTISPTSITIEGRDLAGVFYGIATLTQIVESCGCVLPCLAISDWPDIPQRGIMIDVSRDKVPTLATLKSLIDRLASWKINQLQLYTEHTFAYRRHPTVWQSATPFTGQEMMELDEYCRERFIELVPNQNSFGHLKRWLIHPQYAHLAEAPGEFMAPWGKQTGPFSLCPTNPGSLKLVFELYDELLPYFTSRIVNVGCDETFDLGQGNSKSECEARGQGRVYLDYLLAIYQNLKQRGFTMQFWSDILMNYPDLIPELPKDVIALDWGYEAGAPFEAHAACLEAAGIPFYVCPGTSSWNSLAGRTDNALDNLQSAAESAARHGALGYLNTDWGDNGHVQMLPVSYLGFAAGAAYAWAIEANRSVDIPRLLSLYAFRDKAGVMGPIAYDLGNLYKLAEPLLVNVSNLFSLFQWPIDKIRSRAYLSVLSYSQILEAIDKIILPLRLEQMNIPDREVVLKEYNLTARMLKHACWRGILAFEMDPHKRSQLSERLELEMEAIERDYQDIWLSRNRPGGMVDSLSYFEKARLDYLVEKNLAS